MVGQTHARAAIVTPSLPSRTDNGTEAIPQRDVSSVESADGHASGWIHMPRITAAGACLVEFSSPANLFAVLRKKISGRIRAMYVTCPSHVVKVLHFEQVPDVVGHAEQAMAMEH